MRESSTTPLHYQLCRANISASDAVLTSRQKQQQQRCRIEPTSPSSFSSFILLHKLRLEMRLGNDGSLLAVNVKKKNRFYQCSNFKIEKLLITYYADIQTSIPE
jgi:hypothetical protein